MKATVDQDTCTGCELCQSVCPAVFEMDGPIAKVIGDVVPTDQEDAAREAAESCPVEAITIED